MSRNSSREIFDPVARSLIKHGARPEMKRRILGDLIGHLQGDGWDTPGDSLERFSDDPAIVQAFADHDVFLDDPDEDGPADSGSDVLDLIADIALRLTDATDEGEYHAAGLIHDLATGRKTLAEAREELDAITFRHV